MTYSVNGVQVTKSVVRETFKFFEMAASYYEMRARTQLVGQSGCTLNGYVIGLRQPPPP